MLIHFAPPIQQNAIKSKDKGMNFKAILNGEILSYSFSQNSYRIPFKHR
jgi:hypothetical protein